MYLSDVIEMLVPFSKHFQKQNELYTYLKLIL